MNRISLVMWFVVAIGTAHGQTEPKAKPMGEGEIRFPALPVIKAPSPTTIPKLTADLWYIIDSDQPIFLLAEPPGIVAVSEDAGPVKIKGRFIDGTGKIETRTYSGKQVFTVEAIGTGTVALLIVPKGATKPADVIRKVIDVSNGDGPRPPPVIDPPKPDPPKPGEPIAHLTFVIQAATEQTSAVINDIALRVYLREQKIAIHIYQANDPYLKTSGLDAGVTLAGGAPCMIVQDAKGSIRGAQRLTDVASAMTWLKGTK